MIEAEELIGIKLFQIGENAKDIIEAPVKPGIYQLREYTMKYATVQNTENGRLVSIYNYYLNGVKLDDQWLRRFHFEKAESGNYIRLDVNGYWEIRMDEDVPYMIFNRDTKTKLPFVHRLQAVYSTLTGFELHDKTQLLNVKV
jgi:hypothetical protein